MFDPGIKKVLYSSLILVIGFFTLATLSLALARKTCPERKSTTPSVSCVMEKMLKQIQKQEK